MGFSTALQGRTGHEALLMRQDAEIRLLEHMRRCLSSKVKCDRDYALALTSVSAQGLKIDRPDELSGSLIHRAWRTMLEELESTAKLFRQNADKLESKALDRLQSLHAEKRRCRKLYQEEHLRIANHFNHLTDDVLRKKAEYQKYLEVYKLMRSRFEEHYVKSGRGGRKLDEVRDKYQKACRKLHLTHNEYVLLLSEAKAYESDYRTVLLPGLLEHQQSMQEGFVLAWRLILQEVAQLWDLTSESFKEIRAKIDAALQAISPAEEYTDFTDKHKSTPPSPVPFTFDQSLVQDTSGKLQGGNLTVDNLTVDSLRSRLTELEADLKDCQEKQTKLQSAEKSNGSSLLRQSHDSSTSLNNVESSKKEMNELRSNERQISSQLDLIKSALNELGCEELPSGCDLSVDQSFVESSEDQQQTSPVEAATNDRPLCNEEWFHGVLPREDVVRLLTLEGDFLVRETTRNDESQSVLSVCWGGHKHFIVQTTAEGQCRFEGPSFPSVRELIIHQQQSGLPVTSRSGAVLKRAIPKERWELNNDDVVLSNKIGRGNFGDVYKGYLKISKQEVAIKTCRMTLPEENKKKFLQEGRILKLFDHPNVVKLIGICVQKQPIMIVMELVSGGSLLTHLRNKAAHLTVHQLISMCRDAAAGMRYLESMNCIHRDLAARNCLVGLDNCVKISDFGMSREEEEYIVSDGMKQIPIKWTAPEALNFGKYTSLCDVWSYGILMWEIFSRGGPPYSGLSNSKAREKIDSGYRMPAPAGTPDEMYHLMLRCWSYEPEARPQFEQIYAVVDTLYDAIR